MGKKPKTQTKSNRVLLIIDSPKGGQLLAREADALSRDSVRGLFPVQVAERGGKYRMTYDVTGYITLRNYLKSGLRKQHIAKLLSDVFYTLEDLQKRYYHVSAVLLDHDHVYIDPSTKKARFIFVPVHLYRGGTSIREFYIAFAQNTSHSENENAGYLEELAAVVNRGVNLSMYDLEEYIASISENARERPGRARCGKCGALNKTGAALCAVCGETLQRGG